MPKKLTALIIAVNTILAALFYLSSQLILFSLTSTPTHLVITNFDAFSIYVVAAPDSSPVPTVVTAMPNWPFYVLVAAIIVNVFFIVWARKKK